MVVQLAGDDLDNCHQLLTSIDGMRGIQLHARLGELASLVFRQPGTVFVTEPPAEHGTFLQEVVHADVCYGYYCLPVPADDVHADEQMRIRAFARMTAIQLYQQERLDVAQNHMTQMEVHLKQKDQILDQMNESVVTTDPAGFITSWNRGAEKMFGYTAAEVLGRNILFLYDDEEGSDFVMQHSFLFEDSGEMEVRRRRKSGEVFWAGMSMSVMRGEQGQPVGMIGYLSDITKRKSADERIHQLAFYDPLTGLPNRANFVRTLDQLVAQDDFGAERNMSVMYMDLTRFRSINYTLGHVIGDKLLKEASQRLVKVIGKHDMLAHLNSDKFVLMMQDVNSVSHASDMVQRMIAQLEEPFRINGYELRIGVKLGLSMYPQDARDAETLLRLAEIAMYRVEQDHDHDSEHGFAFYSEEMNYQNLNQLRTEIDLTRAVDNKEFFLQYQPKVDLQTGQITGAEALIRWHHPEHGVLYPNDFIPVAETSGIIARIGEWVMEEVCRQAREWQDEGLAPMRIAMNLTAYDFTPQLPDRVRDAMARHGIAGEWLELEVTESMLMRDTDDVIELMEQICLLDVSLALDDFGTGYSNLSYLKRFPLHTLKMDRSFTIGIPNDENDCAIAHAIISIARQLKQKVVAEGVDDIAQLVFLRDAGCDQLQGYLFSKPIMPQDFKAMVVAGERLDLGHVLDAEHIRKAH